MAAINSPPLCRGRRALKANSRSNHTLPESPKRLFFTVSKRRIDKAICISYTRFFANPFLTHKFIYAIAYMCKKGMNEKLA